MIINTQIEKDEKGLIKSGQSSYSPSDTAKTAIKQVLQDFWLADMVKQKPYREFNNMTLMERQQTDQMRFNGYQETQNSNPDDDWKSNAVRPITRNRVISIAAHLTGTVIYPLVYAQNDRDDEDKQAAVVMRDLMEWSNDQGGYEKTFVNAVIAALVNPAVILYTEYAEVKRTIKEKGEDGKYTIKEIIDEIYSGFQDEIVPLDELWIPDFYENDIQKQPFIIRRKVLTFSVARAKYGSHANWKFVKPGVQTLYAEETGLFYDQSDENLKGINVEEVTYWNHTDDTKLVLVNGILMCEPDECNPRKDKKYPFSKTGYENFDEGKFFWYKSLVFKLGPDEEVVQVLYRMIIDGTYLQLAPPMAVFGDEEITSSISTPGTVVTLSGESKVQNLGIGGNLSAGMNMLEKVESSINESSTDPMQSGMADKSRMTAFEVSRLEQNAKTMLGLFGKMIGFLVKDFGYLRVSDILQYMTLGEVMETTDSSGFMKFNRFIIPNKMSAGKMVTRKINFNIDLPEDEQITEEEKVGTEMKLLEKAGEDTEILEVNPRLFRKMKFLLKIVPDLVTPPSDNVKRALNLEAYDRAVNNPLANQEAIFRDLLLGSYDMTKGDTDKYITTQQSQGMGQMIGAGKAQGNSAVATMANQRGQESAAALMKG